MKGKGRYERKRELCIKGKGGYKRKGRVVKGKWSYKRNRDLI